MGAVWVQKIGRGESAGDAFKELCDDAQEEYGYDRYNGTISTMHLARRVKTFKEANKASRQEAAKIAREMEERDTVEKGEACCIDLGVLEYQVVTAKKVHHTGNEPVIRTKYVCRERWSDQYVNEFDTKKEADDCGMEQAIKNNKSYYTSKEGVVVKGSKNLCTIELETKTYAKKPSLKPMPNRRIIETHEFLFFGWASS